MNNDFIKFKNLDIDRTFILTVLPFAGYLISYLYEIGYCNYWGIPLSLIKIDIESIIYSMITLVIAVIYFALAAYKLLYKRTKQEEIEHNIYSYLIKECLILVSLAFVFIFFFEGSRIVEKVEYALLAFVLTALIEFTYPLIKYSNEKNYKKKLIRFAMRSPKKVDSSIDNIPKVLKFYIFIGSIIVLFAIGAFFIGNRDAKAQRFFYTYQDNDGNKEIVLRIYKDYFISSNITARNNIIDNYSVVRDYSNINFKLEKLDKLKVPDASNKQQPFFPGINP